MTIKDKNQWSLLVIDNNIDNLRNLESILSNKPYKIISIDNTADGYKLLLEHQEQFSAVILGQHIQHIDGIKFLHRINASSTMITIPVIVEDSHTSIEQMETCIRAGARYYIPEPIDATVMPQIIAAAIRDQMRYSQAEHAVLGAKPINCMIRSEFKLKTLTEAQTVANLIAGECPNPRLAAVGITEMLINAIEHGNLGISYAEKTKLHENEKWLDEINRRLQLPENIDKFVDVIFDKSASHINIRITDQGQGFDWRNYQTLNPDRVFDNHGRGIVMARSLTFESLIYHDKGNDVECIIPLTV